MRPSLQRSSRRDQGFTLIELLVVIIIIGILAAVAIPVYLNQRQKSVDASIKSDIKNADIAIQTWIADNPQAGTFNVAEINALFTPSEGNTIQLVGGPNPRPGYIAYCMRGSNLNSSGGAGNYYFFRSHEGGLQPGPMRATDACSAYGGPMTLQ